MDIVQLRANVDATKALLRDISASALLSAFEDFLARNPDVESFRWRQYTPYFNDGEACVFRLGEFYFKPTEEIPGVDYFDYDDGYVSCSSGEVPEEVRDRVRTFVKSIRDTEIFEYAFGDHAVCTASRSGIEVGNYSHD